MIFAVLTIALLQAGAVDSAACQPDRLLQTTVPENRVVLLGTLQKVEDEDTAQLPTFGGSDVTPLLVKVRLRGVVRGDFPVEEGKAFLLGVHSVASTFGYDHVGESYYFGLEPQGESDSNLALASVAIPPGALFFVRASVSEPSSGERGDLPRVDLVSRPSEVVTAVFESGVLPPELSAGVEVALGVPSLNLSIGSLCFGLIRREAPDVRPLRLVRVIR